MLGHKVSLGKYKKIKIITSIFSDDNAMRLKINHEKKNSEKYKLVAAKQHATKPLDHWRNKKCLETN